MVIFREKLLAFIATLGLLMTVESSTGDLKVKVRFPKWVPHSLSRWDETFSVKCEVSGGARPAIVWLRRARGGDEEYHPFRYAIITGDTRTVTLAKFLDIHARYYGKFTCFVRDVEGQEALSKSFTAIGPDRSFIVPDDVSGDGAADDSRGASRQLGPLPLLSHHHAHHDRGHPLAHSIDDLVSIRRRRHNEPYVTIGCGARISETNDHPFMTTVLGAHWPMLVNLYWYYAQNQTKVKEFTGTELEHSSAQPFQRRLPVWRDFASVWTQLFVPTSAPDANYSCQAESDLFEDTVTIRWVHV